MPVDPQAASIQLSYVYETLNAQTHSNTLTPPAEITYRGEQLQKQCNNRGHHNNK